MTQDEWRFNLHFAWENSFFRWFGLIVAALLVTATVLAGIRLIRTSLPSGFFVTHYTVYLGIDQISSLPWLAVLLGVPLVLIFGTILLAYGFYRSDNMAGYALMVLSAFSTIIWAWYLYQLIKINA